MAPDGHAPAGNEGIGAWGINASELVAEAVLEEAEGGEFRGVWLAGMNFEVDGGAMFFEELEGTLDDVTTAAFDIDFHEVGRGLGREEAVEGEALDFQNLVPPGVAAGVLFESAHGVAAGVEAEALGLIVGGCGDGEDLDVFHVIEGEVAAEPIDVFGDGFEGEDLASGSDETGEEEGHLAAIGPEVINGHAWAHVRSYVPEVPVVQGQCVSETHAVLDVVTNTLMGAAENGSDGVGRV